MSILCTHIFCRFYAASIIVKYDNSGGPSAISFVFCPNAEKESLAQCSNLSELNSLTTNKLKKCNFSGGVICTGTLLHSNCLNNVFVFMLVSLFSVLVVCYTHDLYHHCALLSSSINQSIS